MNKRRVVVTGAGVVSSIGIGVQAFELALRRGISGVSEIESFDTTGFPTRMGCEVKGFKPEQWFRILDPRAVGRSSQFCIAGARMALQDAGLDPSALSRGRCGVSIGTTDGESQPIDRLVEQWLRTGAAQLAASLARQVPSHRMSAAVARELDLHGEAVTIPTACAAGNYAVGHAYDLISTGEADLMLCGGADSICRKTFAGFFRLGTIAPRVCQPFDLNRQGILTGEGAGILLLETLESAVARNARIYAEVLGYGLSCDANHPVAPDQKSIVECMRIAHDNAGVRTEQIQYISAHGTGTRANDITEASAIRAVFGEYPPPTSSIKSMVGHTMGAASALSAIACCLAIKSGFMPPTINWETPDPECALDCVPNRAQDAELMFAQNNAFAFGGNNAIVVFGRVQSETRPLRRARQSHNPSADNIIVSGWDVVSAFGVGQAAFRKGLDRAVPAAADIKPLSQGPLPIETACWIPDFDAGRALGSKGTRNMDRTTGLAVLTVGLALSASGLATGAPQPKVGVVLGTATGSLKSIMDFTADTLVQERPYLVNPALFPNTVMNCAAGQCAIWHKLRGMNATISGGHASGLLALNYASVALRRGYADVVVAGAVEELCEQTLWAYHHTSKGGPGQGLLGEGCGMFVLERESTARARGASIEAEILACTLAVYRPDEGRDRQADGLARCIARALEHSRPSEVGWISRLGRTEPELNQVEREAIALVLGEQAAADSFCVSEFLGDCLSAAAAMQLAALLVQPPRAGRDSRSLGLMTSVTRDGTVGCAIVRKVRA